MEDIRKNLSEAREVLSTFLEKDENIENIAHAGKIMVDAIKEKHKILSCGNGGSMCDAMHFAEELTGRFRGHRPSIAAISISDASHITCAANDYGFEQIFARYVEGVGNKGDVLLALSTSGNSENVVQAAWTAKQRQMKIVALTGKSGGKLAEIADVEIRAPQTEFSDRTQEIHIKVIHCLIDHIEREMGYR